MYVTVRRHTSFFVILLTSEKLVFYELLFMRGAVIIIRIMEEGELSNNKVQL